MGVSVTSVKEIWISWSDDVLPDVKMLFIRIKTFGTHFGTFEAVQHKKFLVRNHFLARYVNQNNLCYDVRVTSSNILDTFIISI